MTGETDVALAIVESLAWVLYLAAIERIDIDAKDLSAVKRYFNSLFRS